MVQESFTITEGTQRFLHDEHPNLCPSDTNLSFLVSQIQLQFSSLSDSACIDIFYAITSNISLYEEGMDEM